MTNHISPTDGRQYDRNYLSTVGTREAMANAIAQAKITVVSAANDGYFVGVTPAQDTVVKKLRFYVVGAAGNYDLGIYSAAGTAGTRLWSKGSTVCPAAGVVAVTVTPGVTWEAGVTYYVGWSTDSTSQQIRGLSGLLGADDMLRLADDTPMVYNLSSVFPLPATVTLSTIGTPRLPAISIHGT